MSTTDTTWAARDHARAQGGTVIESMPTVPASLWPDPPEGVSPADLVWPAYLAAGAAARGQ